MNISQKGIAFIKRQEGKFMFNHKHIIYNDATGQPVNTAGPLPLGATIGYGHLIKRGESFRGGLSESEAENLLRRDIKAAEEAINTLTETDGLAQNQYDALVAFVFNIGVANFQKSTVLRYLTDSNFTSLFYPTLESAWKAWDKSRGSAVAGIKNRRNAEWNLFKKGIY